MIALLACGTSASLFFLHESTVQAVSAGPDKAYAVAAFYLARNMAAGFASLSLALTVVFAILYLRVQRRLWLSERGPRAFGECAPVVMYMRNLRGCYTRVNASFPQLGMGAEPLRVADGSAESAIAENAELLAMIAHEIQAPIAAVTSIAYLMNQTLAEDEPGQLASLIEASSYLSAVVRNALEFSRLEAGKSDIQFRRFSLRRRVQHVLELAWRDAMANGVSLFVNVSPDVPDMVIGDDVRVMQILLNFIQNAIHHGGAGLVVLDIAADSVNDLLHDFTFAVRDQGPGIPSEAIGGLFKPFPRIAGRSRGKGSGLGLSIARRLADLMGGSTWMESNAGRGAAFFAKVPLVVDVSHACANQEARFSGKRVWVMDACDASRAVIMSGLSGRGALAEAVDENRPLQAILSDAAGSAPDYVVVDWRVFSQELMDRHDAAFGKGVAHFVVLGPPSSCWNAETAGRRGRVHLYFKPTLLAGFCGRDGKACSSCMAGPTDQEDYFDRNCLTGYAVLLAEDDAIVRGVLREILVLAGAVVHVAADGQEALSVLRHSRVDILLMDIQMPGMNGFETAARIRSMPGGRELPIIAISAYLSEEDRAMAEKWGVACSVTKPVEPSRLLALMSRLLGPREGGEIAPVDGLAAYGADVADVRPFRMMANRIGALDEIRIDNALARLGDRHEIFVNIVRRVVERAESPQSSVNLLLDLQDADSAKLVFHKFVSELGIIGAESLQAQASELEAAARESTLDRDAVERFVQRYKKLIADLRRLAYSV